MRGLNQGRAGGRRSVAWRAVVAAGVIASGLFTISALTNAAKAATFGPDTFMDIGGSIQKDTTTAAASWSNAGTPTTGAPCKNGGVDIAGTTGLFDCGAAVGTAANPFPVKNQTPQFNTSFGSAPNNVFQSTFIIDQTDTSHTTCPSGDTTGSNQFGGGEKFTDDPSSDSYSLGSVQAKDQISNVYAVARQNSQGDDEVYVGLERLVNNGDTHADFQFLQEPVAETTACSGQFTGGVHEQGDIVLEINFDNGGGNPSSNLLLWSCTGTLSGTQAPVTTPCSGTNPSVKYKNATWVAEPECGSGVTGLCYDPSAVQIATNASGTTNCGAWICRDTSGNSVASLPSNDFMEGAVNLEGLGINTGCAATFFPLTRSAGSGFDSQIESFAPPTKFDTCAGTTTATSPSSPTAQLGTGVTDSATVTRAFGTGAPTGSVAFYACGPYTTQPKTNPACTPATTSVPVASLGSVSTPTPTPPANATSATFVSPTPGFKGTSVGWYCFDAEYTPIAGNRLEASNDQSSQYQTECYQVTPLTPTVDTTISYPTDKWVGSSWGDSATVTGTSPYGVPKGSVSWTLCEETGSTPCTGNPNQTPWTTSSDQDSGVAATYVDPAAAVPTSAGTWCFNAVYTSTVANYGNATADPECFPVGPAPSSTSTTVHANNVTLSATGQLTDDVTVTGNSIGGTPGGTVNFFVCHPSTSSTLTPGTCADTGTPEDSGATLSGGTATSTPFTPTGAGTWCFAADYSGGGNYQASADNTPTSSSDPHECILITAAPTTTATVVYDSGNDPYPTSGEVAPVTTYDTATIGQTISGIDPTGTVTYDYYTNGNCDGTPLDTSTTTLSGGAVPASTNNTATKAGSYSYKATYSGDHNYLTSTGSCESFIALAPQSVSAVKTESPDNPAIVGLGSTITYTITLSNTGAAAATGVVVTDDVPGGTSFSSAADGGKESQGTVMWTVDIPARISASQPATTTVSFQVTVDSGDANGQVIPNTAYYTNENTPECSTATCPTNTVNETVEYPVVAAQKSSDPADGATVMPGQDITYTITLTNSGLQPATGVAITDQVPDGTTFVSASNGSQPSSGVVSWTVDISPGTSVSVSFVVTVDSTDVNGQVIPNTANFTNENTTGCKTATCPTNTVDQTVIFPIVAGSKTSSPSDGSTVAPGQDITYTLTFMNSGLADANGVAVTDSVPAGTTFVSAADGGVDNGGVVDWTISVPKGTENTQTQEITDGTPVSVTFVVSVNSDDTNGEVIPNTAEFTNENTTHCQTATCPTNTVQQTVAFPIVVGSKSSQPANGAVVGLGSSITYTISLTNDGLANASNVDVTDAVPAGTTFSSAADGGVLKNGSVTWTVPTVPAGTWDATTKSVTPGSPVTVSFTVTVNSSDANGQVIPNVAQFDNVNTPNCGDHDTCPTNQVSQSVAFPVVTGTKSSNPPDGSIVHPGEQITYTVTLSNSGLANLSDEPVTDTVPAGTTFVSAADGGTLSGNTVSWTVPNVPAGGAGVTVSFTVSVNASDTNGEVIPNVAQYGGVNTNEVQQTVEFPIVTATKSQNPASGSTVTHGDTIVYTITVTNSGGADATNVAVTDGVPAGSTFVSATAGGTDSNGTVTWTIPDVTTSSPATVSFSVTVAQNDTNGQVIPNVAQYTCSSGICSTNTVTADVFVPQSAPAQATTTTSTSTTSTTTTVPPTTTTTQPKQGALAFTGTNLFRTLGGGILLAITGGGFVAISRRRRRPGA